MYCGVLYGKHFTIEQLAEVFILQVMALASLATFGMEVAANGMRTAQLQGDTVGVAANRHHLQSATALGAHAVTNGRAGAAEGVAAFVAARMSHPLPKQPPPPEHHPMYHPPSAAPPQTQPYGYHSQPYGYHSQPYEYHSQPYSQQPYMQPYYPQQSHHQLSYPPPPYHSRQASHHAAAAPSSYPPPPPSYPPPPPSYSHHRPPPPPTQAAPPLQYLPPMY